MTLTDDDIRAIVARAETLQRIGDLSGEDAEALIRAGEELGISKSAMERAVREQLSTRLMPAAGDLVFARSADDKFYAAQVLSPAEDGYRVRFLKGGERQVAADELRECPFLPGDRVTCPWPGWGAWTGTVVSYDAENRALTISDGWAETAVVRGSRRVAGSAQRRAATAEADLRGASSGRRGCRSCSRRADYRPRHVLTPRRSGQHRGIRPVSPLNSCAVMCSRLRGPLDYFWICMSDIHEPRPIGPSFGYLRAPGSPAPSAAMAWVDAWLSGDDAWA